MTMGEPEETLDSSESVKCVNCGRVTLISLDSTLPMTPKCTGCGEMLSTESVATLAGGAPQKHLDRFRLDRMLGRGAYGQVWLAWDPRLERAVALKVPVGDDWTDSERVGLLHEARSAAGLDHENIVRVHEVGDEKQPWLAIEFVDGSDLRAWQQQHIPDARRSSELIRDVASALAHAHERRVIHRDLKPENVLMDKEGQPRVTDFGLARRESSEHTVSHDGSPMGTPAYMAPEQAAGHGHQADARSDIYSLGVMLFELLTKERPFRGSSRMMMQQKQWGDPPGLRTLDDRIPRDLETICVKCLEREPNRRFATAQEVVDELNRFLKGEPIVSRQAGTGERLLRWCRRHRRVVVPTVSSTLLLIVVVAFAFVRISGARDDERTAKEDAQRLSAKNSQLLISESQARKSAESRLADARGAVDLWLTVASDSLQQTPDSTAVRLGLLEEAAAFYDRISEPNEEPNFSQELAHARTYTRLGDVRLELNRVESTAAFARALELLDGLVGRAELTDEQTTELNFERASVLTRIGMTYWQRQDADSARRFLTRAIETFEKLDDQTTSETRSALAVAQFDLSVIELESGRVDRAAMLSNLSVNKFEELAADSTEAAPLLDLATALRQWSRILSRMGQVTLAEEKLRAAGHIYDGLFDLGDDPLTVHQARSEQLVELARCLASLGHIEEAVSTSDQSLIGLRQLAAQEHVTSFHQENLVLALIDNAGLLRDYGQIKPAIVRLEEATRLCSQLLIPLVAEEPQGEKESTFSEQLWATLQVLRGQLSLDQGRTAEAMASLKSAKQFLSNKTEISAHRELWLSCRISLLRALSLDDANVDAKEEMAAIMEQLETYLKEQKSAGATSSRRTIALLLAHLAEVQDELLPETSERSRQLAVRVLSELLKLSPTPQIKHDLARLITQYGSADAQKQAVTMAREAVSAAPENRTWRTTLGAALIRSGQYGKALVELRTATTLADLAAPDAPQEVVAHGRAWFWLAMAEHYSGNDSEKAAAFQRGVDWMDKWLPNQLALRFLRRETQDTISKPSSSGQKLED